MISIIIPTLNESTTIHPCLTALQDFRQQGHEIIVTDGGSSDNTITQAQGLYDRMITTKKGRARQMNAAAAIAQGDVLLFLHADTRLPAHADQLIMEALMKHDWGHFKIRLDDKHLSFRIIETFMNWRSRLSRIATGDQALFIQRQLFEDLHGFPDIDLMEDIAISKLLKSCRQRPYSISTPVISSCRRWRQHGIMPTILLMWRLRLAYFLGAKPSQLAKQYHS